MKLLLWEDHALNLICKRRLFLITPSLDELIDANHPVSLASTVIDSIDIDNLLKKYKDRGTTSYNPRMLLK
ncbi:MAG: hypothetical protein H0V91_12085 [Flavisolibacter sp.]|nr:hypothetical protein [Flavisolibacter sp.]